VPLAGEGFALASTHFPKVNGSGCVKALTNLYSVPAPVGREVQPKAYAAHVEIWLRASALRGTSVVSAGKQKVLNLEHCLEVLSRKPGALAGSTPLEQWRAQGRWPASFDRSWEALKQRRGKQDGTRAFGALEKWTTSAFQN
jgi:hypothetical protein